MNITLSQEDIIVIRSCLKFTRVMSRMLKKYAEQTLKNLDDAVKVSEN